VAKADNYRHTLEARTQGIEPRHPDLESRSPALEHWPVLVFLDDSIDSVHTHNHGQNEKWMTCSNGIDKANNRSRAYKQQGQNRTTFLTSELNTI